MADFRRLTDSFFASPQITVADLAEARDMQVSLIINNRPDGEAADQTPGDDIAAAAAAQGLAYLAIPVGPGGFGSAQIEAMQQALSSAEGKVLAYCRSGTRSTFLWSLAQAKSGMQAAELADAAAAAGYDISPIAPMLNALSGKDA